MATVSSPPNVYDLLLLAANLCEAFKPVNNVAIDEVPSSVLLRCIQPISPITSLVLWLANLTSKRSYTCRSLVLVFNDPVLHLHCPPQLRSKIGWRGSSCGCGPAYWNWPQRGTSERPLRSHSNDIRKLLDPRTHNKFLDSRSSTVERSSTRTAAAWTFLRFFQTIFENTSLWRLKRLVTLSTYRRYINKSIYLSIYLPLWYQRRPVWLPPSGM